MNPWWRSCVKFESQYAHTQCAYTRFKRRVGYETRTRTCKLFSELEWVYRVNWCQKVNRDPWIYVIVSVLPQLFVFVLPFVPFAPPRIAAAPSSHPPHLMRSESCLPRGGCYPWSFFHFHTFPGGWYDNVHLQITQIALTRWWVYSLNFLFWNLMSNLNSVFVAIISLIIVT